MKTPNENANTRFMSAMINGYMRQFSHRGQEVILNTLERATGSRLWIARSDDGFEVLVNRRDFLQRHILKYGCWDREVSDVLKSMLNASDVFFDIGANIGYFALLAAKRGVKTIVAFEPFPVLVRRLERNIALNRYESVIRIVPLGLGSDPGFSHYEPGPEWNSGAGHVVTGATGGVGVEIRLTTLDVYLDEAACPPPTIIKLDVEGFEFKVLSGARRLLDSSPPRAIIFESNCNMDGVLLDKELHALLRDVGYRIRHLARAQHEPKENFMAVLE